MLTYLTVDIQRRSVKPGRSICQCSGILDLSLGFFAPVDVDSQCRIKSSLFPRILDRSIVTIQPHWAWSVHCE